MIYLIFLFIIFQVFTSREENNFLAQFVLPQTLKMQSQKADWLIIVSECCTYGRFGT